MSILYWIAVGWWLEPILLILKLIWIVLIGFPLKILKYAAAFIVVAVIGTYAVGIILAVGICMVIPVCVFGIFTCLIALITKMRGSKS